MSKEQPKQNSEYFGASDEFFSEMGKKVGESWLLPETILANILEDAFGE